MVRPPSSLFELVRPTAPSHASPDCRGLNGPEQGGSPRSGAVTSRVSSAGGVSGGVSAGASMRLPAARRPRPHRDIRAFFRLAGIGLKCFIIQVLSGRPSFRDIHSEGDD